MTRLFLAAGVAALAIAMPASAKPGGGHGGGQQQQAAPQRGGGGGQAFRMQRSGGGGSQRFQIQSFSRHGGGEARQMRSVEQRQFRAPRQQRQTFALQSHGHGNNTRVDRNHGSQLRTVRVQPHQERSILQANRIDHRQLRAAERQQNRAAIIDRQQMRGDRIERAHGFADRQVFDTRLGRFGDQLATRDAIRANRLNGARLADWGDRDRWDRGFSRGLIDGCPPGLWMKGNGCLPPGQARKLLGRVIPDDIRARSLPYALSTFYPDTNDYYWRYDDGYMYRVDRTSNLVAALLPLIGGGYVPGSMFPTAYSPYYNSGYTLPSYFGDPYVSDYYGWNAFYPDTPYVDYRYLNGNVYGVDPYTGLIEDVIPTYAYGYGVGQVLPAGYDYYNVPYQYRSLYYDTSDYDYWYAPGAIYQVDPGSQLITSVASLLAPGLSVGQPLPMGYDVYNVPYDYRATYYDTPNAWYRYNNGYIYQVDPATRLVTAIVASLLT
jgi:hypothetical protein